VRYVQIGHAERKEWHGFPTPCVHSEPQHKPHVLPPGQQKKNRSVEDGGEGYHGQKKNGPLLPKSVIRLLPAAEVGSEVGLEAGERGEGILGAVVGC
jgi:hypothetical protein